MPGTSSRATALLGIGATFEGVLRHHTIMPDGSIRDSAYYSVIAAEWPAVKARLEAPGSPVDRDHDDLTTTRPASRSGS